MEGRVNRVIGCEPTTFFLVVSCLIQSHLRLQSPWSKLTHSACSSRTWERRSYCSACICSVWRQSVFACGRGGLNGQQRLCHSGRRQRASPPCVSACDLEAATACWRLCCTPRTCAWGRGWGCAWPALAWIRTLYYRWDTCGPSCCPGCDASACVCWGWRRWRTSCRTHCRCDEACRLPSPEPHRWHCCFWSLHHDSPHLPFASSARQRWRRHPWCNPRPGPPIHQCRSRWRSCQTGGCRGASGQGHSTPLRCSPGCTGGLTLVKQACAPSSSPPGIQMAWCNPGCILDKRNTQTQLAKGCDE